MPSYQTIVVGLGAAGITAATTLAKAGVRVLGLEAQNRLGGRVYTVAFGDGVAELGAEWLHGSDPNRVYDAAIEHDINLLAQDLPLNIYLSTGQKPDQRYQDAFNELVDYIFLLSDVSSDKPESLASYCKRKLEEYLETQKPELMSNQELIDQVLDFSNQLMNNYNAANDWNDISAQGKFEQLEGHQHLSWHRFGYNTFFDIMLNNGGGFPTLDIKRNKEVTTIEWPEEQRQVLVKCRDGATYSADNVIVTVSLGVLKERHTTLFKPQLPDDKIKAIENLAMGVMDKIELAFDKIWWPTDSGTFFGFIWKEGDKKSLAKDDLWMVNVFAASRTMGAGNVLTMWTSGEVAKRVETLPIEEVKVKCIRILQRFMGDSAKVIVPEPTAIERSTWFTNPYTRGSYSYDNMATLNYPTLREDLARHLSDGGGLPRVLFAGEATHETYFSTVHGAADTGYREAKKLLNSLSINCSCKL